MRHRSLETCQRHSYREQGAHDVGPWPNEVGKTEHKSASFFPLIGLGLNGSQRRQPLCGPSLDAEKRTR
jgi:hypothetical protein